MFAFSNFTTQASCKGNFKSVALLILVFAHFSCKDDFFTEGAGSTSRINSGAERQNVLQPGGLYSIGGNIIIATIHLCIAENHGIVLLKQGFFCK